MKKAFLIAILGMGALTSMAHAYDYNQNIEDLRRYSDMKQFSDMLKQGSFIPVIRSRVDCGNNFGSFGDLNQYRDHWQRDLDRLPRQQHVYPDGMGGYYWYN